MGEKLDAEVARVVQYATDRKLAYQVVDSQSFGTTSMVRQILTGPLPGGADGSIHVMSTEVMMPGSAEATVTNLVKVTFSIPESVAFVPTLRCHPPGFGMDALTSQLLGQVPGAQRLKTEHFESIKLDRQFDIEVNPRQDEAWMRELFPPTFIDWLAEEAPPRLVFALDQGVLHVGTDQSAPDPATLDKLAEIATKVASRIRDECAEEAAVGPSSKALMSTSDTHAAERPGFIPRRGALANVGCSVIASSVFVFGLVFVIALIVRLGMTGSWTKSVPVALIAGAVGAVGIAVRIVWSGRALQREELAVRPGDARLVKAYEAKHGLQDEDPAAFHARISGLALPATAAYVMTGMLPSVNVNGSLVLASDHSEPFRPVNWTMLVTSVPGDGALPVLVPQVSSGLASTSDRRSVAIFTKGATSASETELDAFLIACATVLSPPTGTTRSLP